MLLYLSGERGRFIMCLLYCTVDDHECHYHTLQNGVLRWTHEFRRTRGLCYLLLTGRARLTVNSLRVHGRDGARTALLMLLLLKLLLTNPRSQNHIEPGIKSTTVLYCMVLYAVYCTCPRTVRTPRTQNEMCYGTVQCYVLFC